MMIRLVAFALLIGWLSPLSAQVLVEVTLEQEQFLSGEALPATVRITNRSGRTLHLGADETWLSFSVQARGGTVVRKQGEVPVKGEFTLGSSQVAIKKVDLAPYFGLTRPGRYQIVATVQIKEWDGLVNSPPKNFDIIEGGPLWTQDFGVPSAVASGQPPEVRRYALLQANYLRSQLRLYCRLTDAGAKVLKVLPLGEIVSFGRPQAEVDAQSRLHVLHQNGSHTSRYTVIGPDGEVLVRHTYQYVEGRPRLAPDRDGKIGVVGAVRRADKDDMPAPKAND